MKPVLLMSYLKNGFDKLPQGYANMIALNGLFQMVLDQYQKQFLQRLNH